MNRALFSFFFLLISAALFAQSGDNRTLFTIGNEAVPVSEFLRVYTKNNQNGEADFSPKSLEDYLNLYEKFKLKVVEAEALRMDTIESLKNELNMYTDQLSKSYLTTKEIDDQLSVEAYNRMKDEVRVSHILIKLPESPTTKDTLEAYNKIVNLRNKILKGEDFGNTAMQYSEDPSAKSNKGDLGYLTVFQTVYPFETAMYNTAIGQVSMPFRTNFGYHILKVWDKRPNSGQLKLAHIMIIPPKNRTLETNAADEEKIDIIYEKLKNDEYSFEDAAKLYSDDDKTKYRGGELGWFGRGRLTPEFEAAAFALQNNGDFSTPVQTQYGWHIVKRLDYKGVGTYDELKREIKAKIDRDDRSKISHEALISRIKNDYSYIEYPYAIKGVTDLVDESVLSGKWGAPEKSMNEVVLRIGSHEATQQDFINYILKMQKVSRNASSAQILAKEYWQGFADEECENYERGKLPEKYPDYRYLVKEYRDGILLFELMDKEVWSKAVKDTTGLKQYYETVKNNYMYKERAAADIYNCANEAIANKVMKLCTKKDIATIESKLNKNSESKLVSGYSGKYEEGSYDLISKLPFAANTTQMIKNDDGTFTVVNIKDIVKPEPKPLSEVKGYVVSSYQEYLEKNWVDALAKKYPIQLNQEVFNSLIK